MVTNKENQRALTNYNVYQLINKIIYSNLFDTINFVKLKTSTKTIKNNVPFEEFDKKWDPNPIGEFPYKKFFTSHLTDPKVEKFLQDMATQVIDNLYGDSVLPEYNETLYTKFLKEKVILDDIMMMNFSAVDWHEDFISNHPLRVLIPFNTTSIRLYCNETRFKNPKNLLSLNLSCEYKSDLSVELRIDRAITFFESCMHMASPPTKEAKNSSVCLTVPHPIYAVLSDTQTELFNNQLLKSYASETIDEVKSNLKYVPHEWWSSFNNIHTVNAIRKYKFERWARSTGYNIDKYEGITNTPYIEPTTQNAWEAYLIGMKDLYAESSNFVEAYRGL